MLAPSCFSDFGFVLMILFFSSFQLHSPLIARLFFFLLSKIIKVAIQNDQSSRAARAHMECVAGSILCCELVLRGALARVRHQGPGTAGAVSRAVAMAPWCRTAHAVLSPLVSELSSLLAQGGVVLVLDCDVLGVHGLETSSHLEASP